MLDQDKQIGKQEFQDYFIPLYTNPAKTEDEGKVCARCGAIAFDPVITQTAKTLTVSKDDVANLVCSGEYWTLDDHLNIVSVHFDKFADAILRKAQEK